MKEDGRYDDIIGLPHHVSGVHPHMSMHDRAAQFSPFAALTGYEDAVKERARLTDEQVELSEDEKEILDRKLAGILQGERRDEEISVYYFEKDPWKAGGQYRTAKGRVKKVDIFLGILVLDGGETIKIRDIEDIF